MNFEETNTSAMDLRSSKTISRKVAELRNAREVLVSKKYDSLKITAEVGRKYKNEIMAESAQKLSERTMRDRNLLLSRIQEHQDLIEICQKKIVECDEKMGEYNKLPNSSKQILVRKIMKDKAVLEREKAENSLVELGERLQAYKIRITNCEVLSKMLRNEETLEETCI